MSADIYLSGRLFRISYRLNQACITNGTDGRIIVSAPITGEIERLTNDLAKAILATMNTSKPPVSPQT